MSTNALLSSGVTLAVNDGSSPDTWQTIPEVIGVTMEGQSRPNVDVTDINSTARAYKPGLVDFGQCNFTIRYIPDNAVHTIVRNAFLNSTSYQYRITFTDTSPVTTWTFTANVNEFPVDIGDPDTPIQSAIVAKLTGSITVA